jgi:gamma-glutamylcysteine synthetase
LFLTIVCLQAQREALALISDWTAEEREYLRREGPRHGLRTKFRDGTLQVGGCCRARVLAGLVGC